VLICWYILGQPCERDAMHVTEGGCQLLVSCLCCRAADVADVQDWPAHAQGEKGGSVSRWGNPLQQSSCKRRPTRPAAAAEVAAETFCVMRMVNGHLMRLHPVTVVCSWRSGEGKIQHASVYDGKGGWGYVGKAMQVAALVCHGLP
jgi:hypothetical protein